MATERVDPDAIIERAQSERDNITEDAVQAYTWFERHLGELFPRGEAIDSIASVLGCDRGWANRVLSDLVGDGVDPVQQVRADGTSYVGIIDFDSFPDAGAYGFTLYDDVKGKRKRVVCARCVEQADTPSDVGHATAGDGSLPEDADFDTLLNRVTSHYAKHHEKPPEEIEVGASLVSGTTIDSNTAWHAGNDGVDSGLDADVVQDRDLVNEFDNHDTATTGVHGVGQDSLVSDTDVETTVENHRTGETHSLNQPFADHDNTKHLETFAIEGSTNVEDFVSAGDAGDSFIVNSDGSVTAEPPSETTDVHGMGGGKHDPDTVSNINSKISDGQIPTGVEKVIDDTDSPYTTSGENLLLVDSSAGTVEVVLASADVSQGNSVRIVDYGGNAGTNGITVSTEGSETLNPGGLSQLTIGLDGSWVELWSEGSAWYTDQNVSANSVDIGSILGNAVYQSPSDIPSEYEETGNAAYTVSDGLVVFE